MHSFANCINFKSKFSWKRAPGHWEPQTAQVILCPKKYFPLSLSDDLEFKYYGYSDLKIEYRLSTFPVSVIMALLLFFYFGSFSILGGSRTTFIDLTSIHSYQQMDIKRLADVSNFTYTYWNFEFLQLLPVYPIPITVNGTTVQLAGQTQSPRVILIFSLSLHTPNPTVTMIPKQL